MSGFKFRHTCPAIDKAIAGVKSDIVASIGNILSEACPLLTDLIRGQAAQVYADDLYSTIESAFEAVRSTNEEMRRSAERQIEELNERLEHAHAEIAQLQTEAIC